MAKNNYVTNNDFLKTMQEFSDAILAGKGLTSELAKTPTRLEFENLKQRSTN